MSLSKFPLYNRNGYIYMFSCLLDIHNNTFAFKVVGFTTISTGLSSKGRILLAMHGSPMEGH